MRISVITALTTAILIATPPWLLGYGQFLHYTRGDAPFQVAPEKFDLSTLPNQTITFLVSDDGPRKYVANDGYVSVLAQVRQAAQAWNAVSGSALRVAFGGQYTPGTPQNGPAAQVVFEDLPPGVLGYGGPVSTSAINTRASTPFFPITAAKMHLSRNLAKQPGPSYSEAFFLLTVHEMGHALGLQHTFTSSVMSTVATRATSILHPIDADDVAGLAVLYPVNAFVSATGRIRGQVNFNNGDPAHLASVVAIRSGAPAISALSLPDGSFEISGVPPGQYFVYAHALPPTADFVNPLDADNNEVLPSAPFDTVIYPGAHDFLNASAVSVEAGKVTSGIGFNVTPRSAVDLYAVSVYSFFGENAVHPGEFNSAKGRGTVVASGAGLGNNGNTRSGLGVQVIGGSASVSAVRPYQANGYTYLALDLQSNPLAGGGPQHLVFNSPDALYVLPAAINLVKADAPTITGIAPGDDGAVQLTANGLMPTSQIYFDGLAAQLLSLDITAGTTVVKPPAGMPGQTAVLTVANTDSQNSSFVQSAAPVTYTYPSGSSPTFSALPNHVPAGSEAAIEIDGVNTHFAAGSTIAGWGSSDVLVRQVFVLGPSRLLANVSVPASAAQTATEVSVMTGFEAIAQPAAFTIDPPIANQPVPYPAMFNAIPGQAGNYPGAIVSLYGSNFQAGKAPARVTFDGHSARLLYSSASQINLYIPSDLKPGPALLVVDNGSVSSLPVAVGIDLAQPVITAVRIGSVVRGGTTVSVSLDGIPAGIDISRLAIRVGGIGTLATAVTSDEHGTRVDFALPDGVPSGAQPLIVYLDGRSSTQATLNVEAGSSSD